MAPYNYNNYYDPVGSQSNNQQQQGYTYQTSGTNQYPSQSNTNYQANYSQNYGNAYSNQQYGTTAQQPTVAATATNRNASTLNSLTGTSYPQNTTSNRSSGNVASSYDTNTYYASAGFAAMNDRNQSNNSPLYSTGTGASTFGRLSLPEQPQSSSSTYGNSQSYQNPSSNASTQYRNAPSSASSRSYKNAYHQAQNQTQPPQRYASPLHAVQAQQQHHGHNKQPSRSSNPQPSPQMSVQNVQQQDNYQRQTSASVEPSPTTVDPTQVYDFRAEQQRKAQVEAEKRKKREAERAARKAEEDARKAEEERRIAEEAARKEEQERLEREKREAEEKAKKAEEEAAKKKAAADRKNAQRRKAREEKRQSQTAATALTQMASGSAADAALAGMPGVGDMSAPPANDEEAEMRAMFKKMREFNARNPAMLAKLWEEERQSHATQTGSPSQPAAKPAQTAASKKQQATQAAPAQSGQQNTGIRPFKPVNAPAPAAPQSQTPKTATPSQQQAGAALWPPHKKGSLAEAAATWLNNLPQNRNMARSISKEAVLKILDSNPSYVQLCESLETTGIKFERSDLAKELLKAVPDVRQQKPGAPAANGLPLQATSSPMTGEAPKRKPGRPKKDQPLNYSTAKPSQGSGPVHYQTPVFSLANAAREVNSMSTASTMGGSSSLASAIANAQGPSDMQSSYFMDQPIVDDTGPDPVAIEVKDEEKPEEPPKPPADKEEAARKRTFNDLVDLTKDNDSDDEGPPRKLQQPIAGPSNGAVKHLPPNNGFSKPMTFQQFLNRTGPIQHNQPPYQTPYGHSQQQFQQRPPMPIPPQVLPSQTRPSGPTEEQKQQERLRGKMLVEPIMRDRVARKSKYDSRTIARDVLLATGRHPDMRPLNAHLSSMQKMLADHGGAIDGAGNKSDLSTIRWDIIDPGEPAEDAKAKVKSAAERREKAVAGDGDGEDAEADDEGEGLPSRAQDALRKIRNGEDVREEDLSNIEDPMVRKQIKNRLKVREQSQKYRRSAGGDQDEGNYVSVQSQIRKTAATKPKRIGRPPKTATSSQRASPAVHHNLSDIDNNNNDILGSDLTPNQKSKKSRASNASPAMSAGKAVGYAAFQQYDENGNPIKKKGRPVGWRKSIHSREAHGLDPAKSGGASYKPSGSRLRQSTGPSPSMDKTVQPQYQIYKCKWSDCGAQLDNLERLKKHVVKLHGSQNQDSRFECQWQPCRYQGKHIDENGKAHAGDDGVSTFDTIEYWMKHVNKEHLDEVAWKLGDGPRGGSVSEQHTDSEAYLSDAKGRSVTPLIVPSFERTDDSSFPTLTSNLAPAGGKGKAPATASNGFTTKEQKQAEIEIKKLTDKKVREGLTMGRQGCTLATEQRRKGFLDDEDFEDVIYDSD